MNYRQIVWIASFPKSGNTWVRMFLDAYFLGEIDINDVVCSVGDDRAELYALGDGSQTETFPVDMQHMMRPAAFLRLVRQYNDANHGIPLFVKTHTAHMLANGIELLPMSLTKATIFIVRDPRDVLPSYAKHMGCDLDQALEWMNDKYRTLNSGPGRVADFISSWDDHTQSFLNADTHNVAVFRYEDMRADPETEFARILEHAGVTPDPEKVRAALELVDLAKLRETEKKDGFRESSPHAKDQFFGKGEVGKVIDPRHKFRIEKDFRRVMKRLGYLEKARAWH